MEKEQVMLKEALPLELQYVLEENGNLLNGEEDLITAVRMFMKTAINEIEQKMQQTGNQFRLIDNSRGKITNLKIYNEIIETLTQIEKEIEEKLKDNPNPSLRVNKGNEIDKIKYVHIISKAILFLNNESKVYMEAYSKRYTFVMLEYNSIVSSVIRALGILVAAVKTENPLTPNIVINNSIKVLMQYIEDIEDKQRRKEELASSVLFQESFSEIKSTKDVILFETEDMFTNILRGLKSVFEKLADNPVINKIMYYAVKVIRILSTFKNAIYPLLIQGQGIFQYAGLISGYVKSFLNSNSLMSKDTNTDKEIGLNPEQQKIAEYISKTVSTADNNAEHVIKNENQKISNEFTNVLTKKMNEKAVVNPLLDF